MTMAIGIGNRVRLRNGAKAIIIERRTFRFTDHAGKKKSIDFWSGRIARTRQRCSWQIDGFYSPVKKGRPHELDIVGIDR